jgi:hypothetical protein
MGAAGLNRLTSLEIGVSDEIPPAIHDFLAVVTSAT